METTKIEVGQKLWWVSKWRSYQPPGWVEVTKVGRVYATISFKNIRIRLTNLEGVDQDSYRDSGRCYVSKEACEAREAVWVALAIKQIEAARQLLGLHVEDV